jgi:hypothetical protein
MRNGRYFAYRRSDYSLILADDPRFARIYRTRKGARIACALYWAYYGLQMVPMPAPEKKPAVAGCDRAAGGVSQEAPSLSAAT